MKLLLLLSISALCSADTLYRAVDCSSQECQALFPTIDMSGSADLLTQPLPPLGHEAPLTRYFFGGARGDGSWAALDVCDEDGDCNLMLQQDGVYESTGFGNWSPMGFDAIINSSGLVLAHFSSCYGPRQYLTGLGCVDPGPSGLAEGGFGTFLNINDAGDILQVGGEYALTRLTQQPEQIVALDAVECIVGRIDPVPEPSAVWLSLAALVLLAFLFYLERKGIL